MNHRRVQSVTLSGFKALVMFFLGVSKGSQTLAGFFPTKRVVAAVFFRHNVLLPGVESDRAIIETEILNLFDEALEPPLSSLGLIAGLSKGNQWLISP